MAAENKEQSRTIETSKTKKGQRLDQIFVFSAAYCMYCVCVCANARPY